MGKKTKQLNIRVEAEDLAILAAIEEKHYINPSLLTRGLIAAAVDFYRENGWFSFPVSVSCKLPEEAMTVGGKPLPEQLRTLQRAGLSAKKTGNQTPTKH